MPLDTRATMQHYLLILSFLRVLRIEEQSPAIVSGFLLRAALVMGTLPSSQRRLAMVRSKRKAFSLLQMVELHGDLGGLSLPDIRSEVERTDFAWAGTDAYHLQLLVQGGFLAKSEPTDQMPAKVQLTWSGHDLLDSLREEFGET
ncbi:MAG: hypothetical protein ACOKSU_26120 [Pseudomonas sp.]|uniref:hypothetical protein n=1 Tax=Pseudomonas TaxID=286 RepID=UPI0003C0692D|nr:hypothetical protein [Pseudomonas sp. VLB120]AGZ34694.1 hypothetical protein PVLB_09480 [Pseudomonas sp. VLB120]